MAPSRLAKLWLTALILTVVLTAASAAATTAAPTTEDDSVEAGGQEDGMTKDDGTEQDDVSNQDDAMEKDDGMEQADGTGDNDPADEQAADEEAEDDSAMDDDVPTGGGAGADADASVGDDAEEPVDDDSADAEDADDVTEEKAGTGKRSVGDVWKSIQEKAKSTWEEIKKKVMDQEDRNKAIDEWPEALKNRFTGEVKDMILKRNFSGLTEAQINNFQKNQLLLILPRYRLPGINETTRKAMYKQSKKLGYYQGMRRLLESFPGDDRSALITMISEVAPRLSPKSEKLLLMNMAGELGDPKNWTAAEVDMMKSKKMLENMSPSLLKMINETNIISKITVPSKNALRDMPPAAKMAWAEFILYKKNLSKKVDEWAASDISAAEIKDNLGRMPLKALEMIKNDSLYAAFPAPAPASTEDGAGDDAQEFGTAQGRLLAKKLMSQFKEVADKPSPAQVKDFATKRLGKLAMYIGPDDLKALVDSTKQDNAADMKDMLRGVFNKDSQRSKRCAVFKETEKDTNLATFDTAKVTALVTDGTLECVPQKYLNMWIEGGKLTATQVSTATLSPGKRRAMASAVVKLPKFTNSAGRLDVPNVPPMLMSAASANDIKNTDFTVLRTKIKAGAKLDMSQRDMVVHKGTADQIADANIGAEYTEMVPVSDLKKLTPAKKKSAAMSAGPDSLLRMLSADDPVSALPSEITSSNADKLLHPGLSFMDADDLAKSITTDTIQEVLEKLQELMGDSDDPSGSDGLSPKLCRTLKKLLANATQLQFQDSDDDASILATLTGTGLGSLPPCITGRLRSATVQDKANPTQKKSILSSVGQLKPAQLKKMNKHNLHGLVREGLMALRPSGDLRVKDAEMIGMAAAAMDGSDINRLDMGAFEALKMYFQDACLTPAQADAIGNRLVRYYGEPETWKDDELMCPLLPLLDDSVLRGVREGSMAAACGASMMNTNVAMKRFEETAQMLCKRQMSNGEYTTMMDRRLNFEQRLARGAMMNLKELMDMLDTTTPAEDAASDSAVARRRRRSSDSKLTCEMVQPPHKVQLHSVSLLREMDVTEVKMCQKDLGAHEADNDKLEIIWNKLKEAYSDDVGKVPIKDVGYVAAVIPVDDIKKLDLTTYDAVSALGQPIKMSNEQLMEVAKRAKSQFSGLSGEPSSYTADNMVAAGQIICGMGADDVAEIPNDAIKPVLSRLGGIDWCDTAVAEKLAEKFLAMNGGTADKLGKAEVNAMKGLIGALDAMQLKKIPATSMAGLSAEGMKSIPASKIAVITPEQAGQLSLAAATSMSDDQKDKLPEDSQKALDEVLEEYLKPKGGAEHVVGVLMPLLLMAFAVTRLA